MNEIALESEFFNEESWTSSRDHVNIIIVLLILHRYIWVYVLFNSDESICML